MNKHNKHYQQFAQEPRCQISGLRKAGMSIRAIAGEVGVHFSTISRDYAGIRERATMSQVWLINSVKNVEGQRPKQIRVLK